MTEVQVFENNKHFKEIKARISRKTTYAARKSLVDKALDTKYFMENRDAAEALKALLDMEENNSDALFTKPIKKKIANVSGGGVHRSPLAPLVIEKGEDTLSFVFKLINNQEYQRALDLSLKSENIGTCIGRARFIVTYCLEDQKKLVANQLFQYLTVHGHPVHASILAECASCMGSDQLKAVAKKIILGRVEKSIHKKSMDTSICRILLSGMETLGGCDQEMGDLANAWEDAPEKTKNDYNLSASIEIICKRNQIIY